MLICIEGSDASGKETQSKLLCEYFKSKGIPTQWISFPDYSSDSSILVKMYLNGCFGDSPDSVNPQAASILFACDRFASYNLNWKRAYLENHVIVADRYTTSNAVHQASKIDDELERNIFLDWLFHLEYKIFGIPKPDYIIFLNVPFDVSWELMKNRANKISGDTKKDIHESDVAYLKKVNRNALEIAGKLNWIQIDCVDKNNIMKSVEQIQSEIVKAIDEKISDVR